MRITLKHALLRRWTFRMRLTVLYGAVFLLAGVLLLGITYLLVQQRLERQAEALAKQRDTVGPRACRCSEATKGSRSPTAGG